MGTPGGFKPVQIAQTILFSFRNVSIIKFIPKKLVCCVEWKKKTMSAKPINNDTQANIFS